MTTVSAPAAWQLHRSAAETFADPSTPEHVLLNLPVLDDDSWAALAARPNASEAMLERIVRATGAASLNRSSLLADDVALVIGSQPGLTQEHLCQLADLLYLRTNTTGVAAAVRALIAHPSCDDDAVIVTLSAPLDPQDDWMRETLSNFNRPGVIKVLRDSGHPVAGALTLLSLDKEREYDVQAAEIAETAGRVRETAAQLNIDPARLVTLILGIGQNWHGTAQDLLGACVDLLSPTAAR